MIAGNDSDTFTIEALNAGWTSSDRVRLYRRDSKFGIPYGLAGYWNIGRNVEYDTNTWSALPPLYYVWNRHYHTALGRWLTPDPIGLWGDPAQRGNPYQYCNSSPTRTVDASGLMSIEYSHGGEHQHEMYKHGGFSSDHELHAWWKHQRDHGIRKQNPHWSAIYAAYQQMQWTFASPTHRVGYLKALREAVQWEKANPPKPHQPMGFFFEGTGHNGSSGSIISRLRGSYARAGGDARYFRGGGIVWWPIRYLMALQLPLLPLSLFLIGGGEYGPEITRDNRCDKNVEEAIEVVKERIAREGHGSFPIDVFGWSRGGVSALEFTKRLASGVEVNGRIFKISVRYIGLLDPCGAGGPEMWVSGVNKDTVYGRPWAVWVGYADPSAPGASDTLWPDDVVFPESRIRHAYGGTILWQPYPVDHENIGLPFSSSAESDLKSDATRRGGVQWR